MTGTLTAPPGPPVPGPASAGRRRHLRGVAWLAWRQHRLLIGVTLLLLVAGSAALLWQHSVLSHDLAVLRTARCTGEQDLTQSRCFPAQHYVSKHSGDFPSSFQPALAAVPLLIGMFVGAPLLALEYERGTSELAWSQSVSRPRWLAARLSVPLAVVLLGGTVLALLAHWVYWDSQASSVVLSDPPFQGLTYPVIGPVAVATALFALALGTALGALLRHTLTAVGLTGVLLVLVEAALFQVRRYFWPLVYATQPNTTGQFQQPHNALLVSNGVLLPDGRRLSEGYCATHRGCLAAKTVYGSYQPVSHLLQIQLVESGILLALTVALFALVLHRVRRGPA